MTVSTNPEAKLRILVGRSSFDRRAFTIWIRSEDGGPPKKHRRYRANEAKEIFLPLRPIQIIIADSDVSRHAQPIEGETFTVSQADGHWTVDGTLIADQRGYMPRPIASRDLHFDIVSSANASAARPRRRRSRVLQLLR